MNPLKAGDKAPQFSLPDQDGEIINLGFGVKNNLWGKPMMAFIVSVSSLTQQGK